MKQSGLVWMILFKEKFSQIIFLIKKIINEIYNITIM